jgi:hypothetical protein
MMTKEQSDIVKMVFNRFIDNETETWTDLDSNLELFGYLSDEELIQEAKAKFSYHSEGSFRCLQNHNPDVCFAPFILEAVESILNLHDETRTAIHPNNLYVLKYYLVMSEMRMIYSVMKT